MKYLILNEKNSAQRAFAKALGGMSGHFGNFDYQLVAARGHLLTLDAPEKQINDVNFQDRVKQWSDTSTIPWKLDRFKWNKTYVKGTNYRTGRSETTKKLVDSIKAAAREVDAIVIATDNDPSGEGDVLGQEIIEKIGWKGKVLRCLFDDESPTSIQKAFNNLKDVSDVPRYQNYQKGLAREQFDYATMQLSRLATQFAREKNYDALVTPGRLKSVIIETIFQQARARATFTVSDQYQAIFKDELGTKFVNNDLAKYETENLAGNDMTQLRKSTVVVDSAKRKESKAPNLMDFAQVGVAVSKGGASLKSIISTYQKMYEAGFLSYPRTEDRAMTNEQWNQMLSIAGPIADVVGVDKSLLVQKQARKPYVSDKDLSHGANRPGLSVPNSLGELEAQFGKLGANIYKTLAKSYLATLAPNYQYDMTKAYVKDFPKFTATKNVPVDMGYKAILSGIDSNDEKSEADEDVKFGTTALPTINVSQTTPPQKPSRKFILNYLEKQNVGTGATRMRTLSMLSEGKRPVLKEVKGELQLTPQGNVAGALMQNTMLASPKITKQLTEMTKQVGAGKIPLKNIYSAVNMIIQKDTDRMQQNATQLDSDSYLKDKLPPKSANQASKFHGKFNGQDVAFKKNFMDHRFSQEEANALLAGDEIQIKATVKGVKKLISGKLAQKTFKPKGKESFQYWTFDVTNWG